MFGLKIGKTAGRVFEKSGKGSEGIGFSLWMPSPMANGRVAIWIGWIVSHVPLINSVILPPDRLDRIPLPNDNSNNNSNDTHLRHLLGRHHLQDLAVGRLNELGRSGSAAELKHLGETAASAAAPAGAAGAAVRVTRNGKRLHHSEGVTAGVDRGQLGHFPPRRTWRVEEEEEKEVVVVVV